MASRQPFAAQPAHLEENVPSSIRPNRPDVSDRFPVAGFTVRTGGARYFEVAVATDPALFLPEHRQERNDTNFFSTHDSGPLPAESGEAVYLLPPSAMSRFAGQERLYYALATFADQARSSPQVMHISPETAPSIAISRSFSGRTRAIGVGNPRGGLSGHGYTGKSGASVDWAGDTLPPGKSQVVTVAPGSGNGIGKNPGAARGNNGGGVAVATAPAKAAALSDYDDGFGPWETGLEEDSVASQDDGPGIDGPVPDNGAVVATPQAHSRPLTASEYPGASRFEAASASNYRAGSGTRTIRRIVIHITDGGPNINGTISWFKNPAAGVSAHYVVGQDGEVVQMVHHNDIAWHAHTANRDSIGIEHVANTHGLSPTDAQYCASAALTRWLCDQFGVDINRTNILGHSEADPHTNHTGCPNAVWDWEYYMDLVSSGSCHPRGAVSQPSPASAQSLAVSAKAKTLPRNGGPRPAYGGDARSSSRALDTPPSSTDTNYFTDTDRLDQYMADRRAADAITVSSRDDAHAIINTFRASAAASPWTSLDRATVANRLDELINDPRKIRQGALQLCGPASFFCVWNARDPVGFARYASQLFDNGRASIGSLSVTPSSALLQANYADMVPLMRGDVSQPADWMAMGALRNSEDASWQGSFVGDPRQRFSAMTRPEEIARWLQATGVWDRISNEANWTTLKGVPHATNLQIFNGSDTILLINANLLANALVLQNDRWVPAGFHGDGDWLLSQFPNHFVVLISEVVPGVGTTADTIGLSIWSWGDTWTNLRVPQNDFLNNYYGAVIARLPASATSQSLGAAPARKKQPPYAGDGARTHAGSRTHPFTQGAVTAMDAPTDPDGLERMRRDLEEYSADERAADTITVSSRDDAKAIISTFRASNASSPWASLDRAKVADRLAELIDEPRKIQQGGLNLCGPAAFFCMWNGRDPVGFTRYACRLFDEGTGSIGSLSVAPSAGLLNKDYSLMVPRMGGDICPQADWMVMGALRNSEDVFWQGTFVGDPTQELPGLTRPEEVAQWMRATGVWSRVSNEGNWVTRKGIPHAEGLEILPGGDIALLINVNLLASLADVGRDRKWLQKRFPNHFPVLLTAVVHNQSNDNLDFGLWTWGETKLHLSIPMHDFLDNYYGAVIGRMSSTAISQSLASMPERKRQPSFTRDGGRTRSHTAVKRGAARPLANESFTLNWDDVELIPQPTQYSCWATAAAMVIGWRDQISLTPEKVAEIAGRSARNGLNPDERRQFAAEIGLDCDPPQSYSIDGFRALLERDGPLWVSVQLPGSGHAIVVSGMYSEGAPDGSDTYVRISDPWDRVVGSPGAPGTYLNTHNTGSRYILSWADFASEYEHRASTAPDGTVNAQVLHASADGRQPNRSGAAGYAMGTPTSASEKTQGGPARDAVVEAGAFDEAAIARVRTEAAATADHATASGTDTVTFMNALLRKLYNSALRNPDGSDKPLGSTVQDTMSALQGYGLAQPGQDFEFVDVGGQLTKGAARPDHLRDSVEQWIEHDSNVDRPEGWFCFGASLLDGYHGVILVLVDDAPGSPGTKLYWVDQIHGGFDDVTGGLDQRIASLTQSWWDPQDNAHKPRTRISVWPLNPASH